MAYTYTQDGYDTSVVKPPVTRKPQPGDPDYVAPADYPYAPLPPAQTTDPNGTVGNVGTSTKPGTPKDPNAPNDLTLEGDPGYSSQFDSTGQLIHQPTTTTDNSVDAIITRSLQAAYGRAPTQADLDYWRSAYQQWGYKDPNYFEQRLLGMGAGGKDAALYGQYAGGTGGGTGGSTFQGGNFGLADLSGIGAGGPSYGGGGAGAGSSATPIGSDPFGAIGGGTWVPGIGWYPTSSVTDEMRQRIAAAATTTTAPVAPGTPATTGGVTQDQLDQARNAAILEMLQRQPPTAESLRDTPENQAYQLQSQRSYERGRAALAEDAAQQGYSNTGYAETQRGGLEQQRGEGEAKFLGDLAISRIQAQREDLQYAIDQARNSGQFDKAQALQREAMALDASLRREQMKSTENIAANDLALREFLGRAGLDLDKLRLTQQGQQFLDQLALSYDQLGFNYAQLGVSGNAQAVQPYV